MCDPDPPKMPDPIKPATEPLASATLAPLSADQLRRQNVQNAGSIFEAVRHASFLRNTRSDFQAVGQRSGLRSLDTRIRSFGDGPLIV